MNIAQTHSANDANFFSQTEIQLASEAIFHKMRLDMGQDFEDMEQKIQFLSMFTEAVRATLYEKKGENLDDDAKINLVRLLAKLKKQLELAELQLRNHPSEMKGIRQAADRMLKKSVYLPE